ncbi:unnamed protein product, partial [Phaeothamnion confervicola]
LAVASCGSDDNKASDSTISPAVVSTTPTSSAATTVPDTAPLASAAPDTTGSETTTPPVEQSGKPYKIGLIIEETGNAAAFKDPTMQGYQTALAQLEKSSSRPFEIETCDGGSKPDIAIACYERLVGRDGVDAILGPTVSASALAITPAVNKDHIINYFLGGGYGGRTMEGNPTQFGANATNTDVLTAIWSWANKKGMKDVYMISTADATGQACRDFFEKDEFKEARAGLEILGQDEMAIDAQSAAPQMSKVP